MAAAVTRRIYKPSPWALAVALILAVRLLSPAGFMPAFDRGTVTIVACPDVEPMSGQHRHHGHSNKLHQSCPYAAVSALGALGLGGASPIAMPATGLGPLIERTFTFIERRRPNDRPPPTGPPIPV